MRKLGEKKIFIIDKENLKELMKDEKIKHLFNVVNHSRRNRIICGTINKIQTIIKRNYNCREVMYDNEILGFIELQNGCYKPTINLPIKCKCCEEFTYKEDMHDSDICEGCYQDANAIPRCCRCGGYVDLECNCG